MSYFNHCQTFPLLSRPSVKPQYVKITTQAQVAFRAVHVRNRLGPCWFWNKLILATFWRKNIIWATFEKKYVYNGYSEKSVAILATFEKICFFNYLWKTTFGYFDWFKESVSILATFSPDGSLCPTLFFIYTVLQMASIFLWLSLLCLDLGWNLNISISDQLKFLVDLSRPYNSVMKMVFV